MKRNKRSNWLENLAIFFLVTLLALFPLFTHISLDAVKHLYESNPDTTGMIFYYFMLIFEFLIRVVYLSVAVLALIAFVMIAFSKDNKSTNKQKETNDED